MLAAVRAEKAKREAARKAEAEARAYRERCELDFGFFVRESWPVLEPVKPLVWGWPLQVVCDHAQALVEDWMRATLASIGTLKPIPTGPLPEDETKREAEVLRRHHAENMWREARRLGVLADESGRVGVWSMEKGEVVPPVQRFRKLLVNIPPGYAKSRILSVKLLAWAWTRWPSLTAFCLSTNPDVALRDADFCRDLVKGPWYRDTFRPWWTFSATADAKGRYANSASGWRLSKGWEAKAVGDRADLQLADDPNDPDKAFSEADRQGVNDRWDNTLESRVNDPERSIKIGVQQKVHTNDWSWHVCKVEADWEHLVIEQEKTAKPPCECPSCRRGHTALGWRDTRAVGELALPERFGPAFVAAQKRNSMRWAAQHQQNPMDAEGNMFKASWWKFWRYEDEDDIPELKGRTISIPRDMMWDEMILSCDAAFKGTEGSSKVASGVWARTGPRKFLLDLAWEQLSFTETCAMLRGQVETWEPKGLGAKVIEDKANGPAIIETLSQEIGGIVPFPVNRYGDKQSRAAATAFSVEAGDVYLRLHADWRDRYIGAHSACPKGTGMDAVDQQSQALLRFQQGAGWEDSEGFAFSGERGM